MKNIKFALLLVLLTCCKLENNKKITLLIEIENPMGNYITLKNAPDVINISSFDNEGHVKFEFIPVLKKDTYTISYNDQLVRLVIEEGDDLLVRFSSKKVKESIEINKSKYGFADYILKKNNIAKAFWKDIKGTYSLPIKNYRRKIDSLNREYQNLLKEYNTKNNKSWTDVEQTNITYDYIESFMVYPQEYKFFTKTAATLDSNYLDYEKLLEFNNPDLLASNKYKTVILNYIRLKAGKELNIGRLESIEDFKRLLNKQLMLIDNLIQDKKVKGYFAFKSIADHLKRFGTEGIEDNYTRFLNEANNTSYKNKITDLVERSQVLAKSKQAPDFEFEDTSGNILKLSSFIGKKTYIDVWATWCVPCLKEAIPLAELSNEFTNINFIAISVDENKEVWKAKALEYEKKNPLVKQFTVSGGFKSYFAEKYKVEALPRFILIDEEGKMIDANTLKPSSKRIHRLLSKKPKQHF